MILSLEIINKKLNLFTLFLFFLVLSVGCATNTKKYADKVGCKGDANVVEDSSSPLHETYLVECNGKSYRCTETPLGSRCSKK